MVLRVDQVLTPKSKLVTLNHSLSSQPSSSSYYRDSDYTTTMCRLLMLSRAALLLVFVGVLPEAIHCVPVSGGLIDVPGTNDGPQCVEFTNHYCNQFENRSTAYFPNPRGHKTLEEAEKEFNDFIPLLQSGCHPKLGTLLCFIYFPFCESAYPALRIYPCKEVCEEVTRDDSQCTTLINQYAGWNAQLQCNMPYFKPKSSLQCADGIAPVYPGKFELHESRFNVRVINIILAKLYLRKGEGLAIVPDNL